MNPNNIRNADGLDVDQNDPKSSSLHGDSNIGYIDLGAVSFENLN
jgi:hypothetical protein